MSDPLDIKQSEKPAPCEASGKFFELVKFSRQVATADERADRRARNHAYLDPGLVERTKNTDMSPAARRSAAKRK